MRFATCLMLTVAVALSAALTACGSLGGGDPSSVEARILVSGDPAVYGAIVRIETAPGYELALDRATLESTVLTMRLTVTSPPAGTEGGGSIVRHQVGHETGASSISELRVLLRTADADPAATPSEYALAAVTN